MDDRSVPIQLDAARLPAVRPGRGRGRAARLPAGRPLAAVRAAYSPDARVEALTSYATTPADPAIAEARLGDLEGETIEGGWTVTELLRADADCIVAAIDYPEGGNPDGGLAVLLAGYDDADRDDLNPTPWVLDRHGPGSVLTEEEALERCGTVETYASSGWPLPRRRHRPHLDQRRRPHGDGDAGLDGSWAGGGLDVTVTAELAPSSVDLPVGEVQSVRTD